MSSDKQKCFKCLGDGQVNPYGDLSLPKTQCNACQGHGYIEKYFLKCPKCNGVGFLFPYEEDQFNPYDCPLCNGKGHINFYTEKCKECNGTGDCNHCLKGYINKGQVQIIDKKSLKKKFRKSKTKEKINFNPSEQANLSFNGNNNNNNTNNDKLNNSNHSNNSDKNKDNSFCLLKSNNNSRNNSCNSHKNNPSNTTTENKPLASSFQAKNSSFLNNSQNFKKSIRINSSDAKHPNNNSQIVNSNSKQFSNRVYGFYPNQNLRNSNGPQNSNTPLPGKIININSMFPPFNAPNFIQQPNKNIYPNPNINHMIPHPNKQQFIRPQIPFQPRLPPSMPSMVDFGQPFIQPIQSNIQNQNPFQTNENTVIPNNTQNTNYPSFENDQFLQREHQDAIMVTSQTLNPNRKINPYSNDSDGSYYSFPSAPDITSQNQYFNQPNNYQQNIVPFSNSIQPPPPPQNIIQPPSFPTQSNYNTPQSNYIPPQTNYNIPAKNYNLPPQNYNSQSQSYYSQLPPLQYQQNIYPPIEQQNNYSQTSIPITNNYSYIDNQTNFMNNECQNNTNINEIPVNPYPKFDEPNTYNPVINPISNPINNEDNYSSLDMNNPYPSLEAINNNLNSQPPSLYNQMNLQMNPPEQINQTGNNKTLNFK